MDTCILSGEQVQFLATSGPPAQVPSRLLPRRDARWLVSLQFWAGGILRRLHIAEADITPLVLEAFAQAAAQWSTFEPPEELPARIARRRWIAGLLFRLVAEHRRASRPAREPERRSRARATEEAAAGQDERMLIARSLLRRFKRGTTVVRWRIWLAREVDGVVPSEIACQEGRSVSRVRSLLERARRDLEVSLLREEAGSHPALPRYSRA